MPSLAQNIAQLSDQMGKLSPRDQASAASLILQFEKRGRLTDPQIKFVDSLVKKTLPKSAAAIPTVSNFKSIIKVFDQAQERGLKSPKLKFATDEVGKINLSPAKSYSSNRGMIYVQLNGEYAGKIDRNGGFQQTEVSTPILFKALEIFAKNPLEYAKAYGKRTGNCMCCGLELTNKRSIELGIGPICADKYF